MIKVKGKARASMETDAHFNILLSRWQDARQRGTPSSVEELCTDCPELVEELRRRIEALHVVDPALDPSTDLITTPGERGSHPARANRRLPDAMCAAAVYRPQRHHAQGGLGEVLTAHQEELDRTVALKRIRPDKLHEAARRRFLREATITARLQHPGIVPIYGLGQDDDGPFYTMPFIEGQTLQEAISAFHGDDSLRREPGRRSLRFRGLLQQFIAICNTVAYAHD
jgi:serine/threonine protein kinase